MSTFLRASSLNEYLYEQIQYSNWQVTSLVATTYLAVGVTGINHATSDTTDDPFVVFINGSTYIQDNCVVANDMYIYGNINISGNSNLNTLNVTTFRVFDTALIKNIDVSNCSIINSKINNISVDNLSIYTTLISICDASFNKKIDVFDDATFYKNVSLNNITVTNAALFNSNISVPILTVTHNASIQNISCDNLIVNTSSTINILNVSYINVSNTANISKLNISNTSTNTLKVFEDTTLNTLVVSGTTNLNNGATIVGPLTSNNLTSSNTTLNGAITINGTTTINSNAYIDGGSLKIGGNPAAFVNSSSILDVNGQTYIQTLYVGQIYTNSRIEQANVSIITNIGIGQFSVRNTTPNTRTCYCYIGEDSAPVYLDIHAYGNINFGLRNTNVPETLTYTSIFNMKAKSTPINAITSIDNISNNGIIYEGPIQIGNTSTCLLNISAAGSINFDGSMNIGKYRTTQLNISSYGNIKFYSDASVNTILDIDASSVLYGIKYRGQLDVSGNFFLDGNINLTGNVYSRSDIKIKNNILKLENSLSKIQNLNGYKYTRSDLLNISKIHIGLIAQEVEKEYPEIISEENNIKTINYTSMIAILLESIKELKKELNELKSK